MDKIRKAAVAGMFYTDDKDELQAQINNFLDQAEVQKVDGKLKALIVPHAGLVYSGQVAAYAYKLLQNSSYKRAIIIGLSHRSNFSGLALGKYNKWETPIGIVKQEYLERNKITEPIVLLDQPHIQEHSIEVQLPFLQTVKPDISIIPLLTGLIKDHKKASESVINLLNDEIILIISTDLSHYLPYDYAKQVDSETIEKILNFNNNINHDDACGRDGILILMQIARQLNWKPGLLKYLNSGDTAGDKTGVVGYTAISYCS